MKRKNNLLLCTDYSEIGKSSELYAIQFALNTNSNLTILHVYEKSNNYLSVNNNYASISKNDVRDIELRLLNQYINKLVYTLNISDLDFECIVIEGKAEKEICKLSENSEFDFIIIGAKSTGAFSEFFSSSTTWNVIKKSAVPVIAIPQGCEYKGINNVVFAAEFRSGEIPAINFLVQNLKEYDASLKVLHIIDSTLPEKTESLMIDNFRRDLTNEVFYNKMDIQTPNYYNVIEGLNDYCVRNEIDLLVMSHEKSFFLGNLFNPVSSITRKMAYHTKIPLLSIPDYYQTPNSKFWDLLYLDNEYLEEVM